MPVGQTPAPTSPPAAATRPVAESGRVDAAERAFRLLDTAELPARLLAVAEGASARTAAPRTVLPRGLTAVGGGRVRLDAGVPPLSMSREQWLREPSSREVADRIGRDVLAGLATACAVLNRALPDRWAGVFTAPPRGSAGDVPAVGFTDAALAGRWMREHLALLPALVRGCGAARPRALALAVAAHSWLCAPDDAPTSWATDLVDAGAQVAIDERAPVAFAGLMRLGATWFAARGDVANAERLGVREWTVWETLRYTPGMIDVLWHRTGVYATGRWEARALDCLERLQCLYEKLDDGLGLARVQAATGTIRANLRDDREAVTLLYHAHRALARQPGASAVERAAVLETLAGAQHRLGDHHAARRRWHAALKLLTSSPTAGSDDEEARGQAAHRIRALLDANPPAAGGRDRSRGVAAETP